MSSCLTPSSRGAACHVPRPLGWRDPVIGLLPTGVPALWRSPLSLRQLLAGSRCPVPQCHLHMTRASAPEAALAGARATLQALAQGLASGSLARELEIGGPLGQVGVHSPLEPGLRSERRGCWPPGAVRPAEG